MVMKVVIMMRAIMKIMNSSSYGRVLPIKITTKYFAYYYKIVSPILLQKLVNNFAVCKLYSGILLLVEDDGHGFGN